MITKKEIDDAGKAQYSEWRSNKDRLKMLQAAQAVFTGQEIKVALTDSLYDTYDDTGDYEQDSSSSGFIIPPPRKSNLKKIKDLLDEPGPKRSKTKSLTAEEKKKKAEEAQIKWNQENPHYGLEHEQPVKPKDNSPFADNPYL